MEENRIKLSNFYVGTFIMEEYDEFCDDYFTTTQGIVCLEKLHYKFSIDNKEKICVYKNAVNEKYFYVNKDNTIFDENINYYKYIENLISLRDLLSRYKKVIKILSKENESLVSMYYKVLELVKNKKYITISDTNAIFNYITDLYLYYVSGVIDDIMEKLENVNENNVIEFNKVRSISSKL